LTQSCNYTAPIVNQDIPTNSDENQGDNSGAEDNNPETENQNSEENGQTTSPTNNKTNEEPINLNETKTEINSVKKFFIKFICKLSNLFNSKEYKSCVANYLE
jgi:hypothetical protein